MLEKCDENGEDVTVDTHNYDITKMLEIVATQSEIIDRSYSFIKCFLQFSFSSTIFIHVRQSNITLERLHNEDAHRHSDPSCFHGLLDAFTIGSVSLDVYEGTFS